MNKTESLGIFFLKALSYLPDENLVDIYVFDTGHVLSAWAIDQEIN